ncbi:MAG: hypothetical protein IPH84_09050 [Bacteroidales bacterium]|nr:hypothetical protein [Bacteroidales bacterium]
MKKIIFLLAVTFLSVSSIAQDANDALRYSLISYSGTARFMGLSGAYGALGADFSSLSQNPAGIALYRKSEFMITPGFYGASSEADYFGEKKSDFRNNLTLGNLGMVFASSLNENNEDGFLKGLQFGFGMNRMNTFSNSILVEGFNTNSSLLGYYEDLANNGGNPTNADQLDEFSTLLAYNSNLMVFDSGSVNNPAHYWVDMPDGNVLQRKTIQTSGNTREMMLSGGANFGNKLYLGLSLSFPSIRYEEESNFSEQDSKHLSSNADPDYNFDAAKRSQNLLTKGNGFNLKFGFILKPVEFIRIGGAFHTPTSYNLTDEWSTKMVSYFENGSTYSSDSRVGVYDYRINTPMRAIGSLAIVIGKYGFLTADYEFVDYSTAKLRSNDWEYFDENESIKSTLGSANNLRFGAEIKYHVLAFRVGSSFYGSPYKDETTRGARMGYSAGLGLREKNYFLDFAFNHQVSKDNLYLYGTSFAENTVKSNQFQMTLGFRF